MGGLWKGDLGAVGSQGPLSPPRGAPPPTERAPSCGGKGPGLVGMAVAWGSWAVPPASARSTGAVRRV